MLQISPCNCCPKQCNADRTRTPGVCGCNAKIMAARAALHFDEEPCISGHRGSGAVFFSGCTLGCCFCQNEPISRNRYGMELSADQLSAILLDLQDQGAHNINLVTGAQYLPEILRALKTAKPSLHIPVVYNSGGYERVEAIEAMKGFVDVYLPDLKFFSPDLSWKYAGTRDYFQVASAAIRAMIAQTGPPVLDEDGLLQKGVLVRHLVLPGARKDSIELVDWLGTVLGGDLFLFSLMSQYTPYRTDPAHPELNRRITTFEYESVRREALRVGLTNGYMQERSSAKKEYTPPFNLEGIRKYTELYDMEEKT